MRIFFIIAISQIYLPAFAQTCCTGGVPYLGSFKVPQVASGEFSVGLAYSYNNNSSLIQHNDLVSKNVAQRLVNTQLLQVNYGICNSFIISFSIPYIIQSEKVVLGADDYDIKNNGFGDMSGWVTYQKNLRKGRYSLSAGIKIPTATTNAINPDTGFEYAFSFQNGSGSWDFLFRLHHELPLTNKENLSWLNQISAKLNTKGNNFEAHPRYKFGNIIQLNSLFMTRWVMGSDLVYAHAGVTYQKQLKDAFNTGFKNENTGGDWIYANIGISYHISPKLMAESAFSYPLFMTVNGLQLSTTLLFNLSINYTI